MDIKDIIEKYRESIGLSENDFYKSRKTENKIYRQSIMYYLNTEKSFAWHSLRLLFRLKDHTTVYNSINRISDYLFIKDEYYDKHIKSTIKDFLQVAGNDIPEYKDIKHLFRNPKNRLITAAAIERRNKSKLIDKITLITNKKRLKMDFNSTQLTQIYELIKGFENGNILNDISFRKNS